MIPTTDVQRHMRGRVAGHTGAAICRLLAVNGTASSGFGGMSRASPIGRRASGIADWPPGTPGCMRHRGDRANTTPRMTALGRLREA